MAEAGRRLPHRTGRPSSSPLIEARRLGQRFQVSGQAVTIFEELSLTVAPGGFFSIVGPSGCGKSTLLQIIAGLQRASSGEVRFRDLVVTRPPRGMIYVFQQYTKSIFSWLTVRRNVAFGLRGQRGVSRKVIEERTSDFICRVGLEGYEDYYPSQLSGGMQQRVALARALVCEPEVLLMDEPFSAVDALTRASLQQLVLQLWEGLGLTILFVTHDIDEAVFVSSHAFVMRGRPARVTLNLPIELSYPRDLLHTREDRRFLEYRHLIYEEVFR